MEREYIVGQADVLGHAQRSTLAVCSGLHVRTKPPHQLERWPRSVSEELAEAATTWL